jgi:hypothetical protein
LPTCICAKSEINPIGLFDGDDDVLVCSRDGLEALLLRATHFIARWPFVALGGTSHPQPRGEEPERPPRVPLRLGR